MTNVAVKVLILFSDNTAINYLYIIALYYIATAVYYIITTDTQR